MAISNWAQRHNPNRGVAQMDACYCTSSMAHYVSAASVDFTPTTLPAATLALANQFHGDPMARVLCCSLITDATVGTRGCTLRVVGTNQFGEAADESMVLTPQAASLTRVYFTRNAFSTVTGVFLSAVSGTMTGTTVSVGVSHLEATVVLANIAATQPSGASQTHYKGFGLPIPVSTGGTTPAGGASVLYTSEVWGCSYTGANVPVLLNRGAGFLIDSSYSVMVPQEIVVITGAGIYGLKLWFQTNRGE